MATRKLNNRTIRIEEKLDRSIANGKYYEASQLVKTLYFRYKLQSKYDDAIHLLFSCATHLLEKEQYESGLDIGRLLVKCYTESEKEVTDDSLDQLIEILNKSKKDSPSRKDYIREALVWSSSKNVYGNAKLHLAAAVKYWEERSYSQAREHFIYTSEGTQCASFLIEYHVMCGFPSEVDLFVTQAVLQFLCLRNNPTAHVVFFAYTAHHPGIRRKHHPYRYPLLNFVAFLLIAIECRSLQQFSILCEQYQPSLKRDPTYLQYLDKIGQEFFGLPAKKKEKPGFLGMIGDLFENILTQPPEDGMDIDAATEDVE